MHHKHKNLIKFFKYLTAAFAGYFAIHFCIGYLYGRFYASKYTYVSGRPYDSALCIPAPKLPPDQKTVRILVLPGGAINGILPLHILQYLQNKTNKPIHTLFDLIAATSTGSLIATGLTYPNKYGQPVYNTQAVLKFYTQIGPYALSAPWWYRAITLNGLLGPRYLGTRLSNQLTKIFDQHTEFSQLLTPTMISAFNLTTQKSHTFKSWSCNPDQPNYHIHEILTAATATPGFFPPVVLQDTQKKTEDIYIDGGVAINNPAIQALEAAMKLYPDRKYLIVILDTGNILRAIHWQTAYRWGFMGWLSKVFALLLTTQEHQADSSLRFIQSLMPPGTIKIVRINFNVTKPESKFNPSAQNLELLKQITNDYIKTHQQKLDNLAGELISQSLTRTQ